MKPEKLTSLIALAALLSCGQENDNLQSESPADFDETKVNVDSTFTNEEVAGTESSVDENRLQLKFEEFILEIDHVYVWDEEGKLNQPQKDTSVVYIELGETIEGKTIKIHKLKEGDYKVFQRFENSVTIMDEGPHCDMTEWKHYDSEWKELKITGDEFVTETYSDQEWEKFIDVDMNELRKAVKNHCGDEWEKHIKEVKSPTEYPCGISMSRIFLKIEFNSQGSGTKTERIISFEIPMGC